MNLLLLLLVLLLPRPVGAEEAAPPAPPAGQVLDPSGWLAENDTRLLESELARLRNEYHVDVCVVVWDGPLPGDQDPESFARQLGQSWAREDLGAVVLQHTASAGPPAVACEVAAIDSLGTELVATALAAAIERGMKEWTERTRTTGVALNLAEELVYLRLHHQHDQKTIGQAGKTATLHARQPQTSLAVRIALGVLSALLLAGTFIAVRMRRHRGPAELVFPDTRWRRRLGAEWCGGSDLVTTFTPPEP